MIGTQRGLEMLGRDPRFDATALQTLDLKGWDGVAIAVVTDAAAAGDGTLKPRPSPCNDPVPRHPPG